jgi:2-keto-4-pentenoate hydratase/2-oxohepta-3-ene-1,7-dioic acid hydratase in catechol pathway
LKVCSFRPPGETGGVARLGVVDGETVHEIGAQLALGDLLRQGREADLRGRWVEEHALKDVKLMAPVPRPGKIVAAIVNTQGMLGGDDLRLDRPRLDMKAPSAVIGPDEAIRAPKYGIRPEVELAAVVGRRIANASPEEAEGRIFGYTILNDVTAPRDSKEDAYEAYRRDKASGEIRRTTLRGPLFRSKNHDTFCPLGPWVVTSDELAALGPVKMTTRYDGKLIQSGSTAEYLFGPGEVAAYVSGFLTLEPGDLVSCGSVGWTPEALGGLDPTEFVLPQKAGSLELEVEGIGKLRNPVVIG